LDIFVVATKDLYGLTKNIASSKIIGRHNLDPTFNKTSRDAENALKKYSEKIRLE